MGLNFGHNVSVGNMQDWKESERRWRGAVTRKIK
jgi:hypothetical protein